MADILTLRQTHSKKEAQGSTYSKERYADLCATCATVTPSELVGRDLVIPPLSSPVPIWKALASRAACRHIA
jgi:hypothetical protein